MIDHLHCYACERRIGETADDVVLANKRTGELRFFHAVGDCATWANVAYCALAERDEHWRISIRHAYWIPELGEGLEASETRA
jgi:hypothetical protein